MVQERIKLDHWLCSLSPVLNRHYLQGIFAGLFSSTAFELRASWYEWLIEPDIPRHYSYHDLRYFQELLIRLQNQVIIKLINNPKALLRLMGLPRRCTRVLASNERAYVRQWANGLRYSFYLIEQHPLANKLLDSLADIHTLEVRPLRESLLEMMNLLSQSAIESSRYLKNNMYVKL